MHTDGALPRPSPLSDRIFMREPLQPACELLLQILACSLASCHQVLGAGWMFVEMSEELRQQWTTQKGHGKCTAFQPGPSEGPGVQVQSCNNSLPGLLCGAKGNLTEGRVQSRCRQADPNVLKSQEGEEWGVTIQPVPGTGQPSRAHS